MVSRQQIGMSFREAFGIRPGEVISLVGGGGKTTLMFAMAHEMEAAGEKVISTTTTRIFEPSVSESFLILESDEERMISRLFSELKNHRHLTLASHKLLDGKLKGISPETVDLLTELKVVTYIIVEADGSARKPLKAPNATEPVIPGSTSLVIPVVGIDALGCSLTEDNVFRPEIISRLTGLEPGAPVTEDTIAVLLTHNEGITKSTPANADIVPLINKIDMLPDLSAAESLANKILAKGHPRIKRVVLGQIKRREPVVKVIGD
ncbi:MAG: selenium cofactor biosynthesis protein YqeC [Dehalococcoidales bacterium]|nr:selenium cofactor biosynthesis protein YqeC [Dehalococcoidales bacterium]